MAKRFLVAAAVAALVCGSAASCSDDESSDSGAASTKQADEVTTPAGGGAADDVVVASCTNSGTELTAALEVTNHSDAPSNYAIDIAFESADGEQLGTSNADVSDVQPGQTAKKDANAVEQVTGEVTCKVIDVERNPAS